MKSRWKWLAFSMMILVVACTNADKKTSKINYDQLYFDYTLTADEDGPYATCMLQYKKNSLNGNALNVAPARVELDGQAIEGDSAGLSGFYYEVQRPLDSFSGKHTIVFSTPGSKQYKEEFDFTPFTLAEELPEQVRKESLTIRFTNFPKGENKLRLFLLDSSFLSGGYNELVPVRNGELVIDKSIWDQMKTGPIVMQLSLEKEQPLQQVTKAGGRLSITYGLKREFELVD